ncbi:MAG: hypothetical protein FWH04_04615 [Oscillospiraceae bacterium]|nr:hypothetical protein [Oscillospiraceae bacterium]
MQQKKEELIRLWANGGKRTEFLKNYKEWGEWLTVPELGQTYYQYKLPDGTRIIAMEYKREHSRFTSGDGQLQTITVYYLWEGKWFNPNPTSEYGVTERLKTLKMSMQKELRTETAGSGEEVQDDD